MTTYYNNYPTELQEELRRIANAIVAPGKGILAADESTATCGKRFQVRTFWSCSVKFKLTHHYKILGHRMREQRGEPSRLSWIALHHRQRTVNQHLRCDLVPRNRLPEDRWWRAIHRGPQEEGNNSRNQGRQRRRRFDGIGRWGQLNVIIVQA